MTRTRLFWAATSAISAGVAVLAGHLTTARWALEYVEFTSDDGETSGFWCLYDCSLTAIQIALYGISIVALLFAAVAFLICLRAPWKASSK